MFPPNRLCKCAPKLPTIERERTTIPRTTPNDLTTRYPGSSNVVVVSGCVWLMPPRIEHHFAPRQKLIFPTRPPGNYAAKWPNQDQEHPPCPKCNAPARHKRPARRLRLPGAHPGLFPRSTLPITRLVLGFEGGLGAGLCGLGGAMSWLRPSCA